MLVKVYHFQLMKLKKAKCNIDEFQNSTKHKGQKKSWILMVLVSAKQSFFFDVPLTFV